MKDFFQFEFDLEICLNCNFWAFLNSRTNRFDGCDVGAGVGGCECSVTRLKSSPIFPNLTKK